MTAIVDTQTNEFVPEGHVEDARFIKVTVPRNPDPVTEKYSGDLVNPITSKTPGEIDATKTALADAIDARAFDMQRAIKATVLVAEAGRLGKTLAQLTGAEIAAVRTKWLNAYKSLNGGS